MAGSGPLKKIRGGYLFKSGTIYLAKNSSEHKGLFSFSFGLIFPLNVRGVEREF